MSGINNHLERVAGIEPAYSAWKAAALPLSYTRIPFNNFLPMNGGGGWIRTNVAYATDLQSAPFNHSGTPPLHRQSCAMRHHYNQFLITYPIDWSRGGYADYYRICQQNKYNSVQNSLIILKYSFFLSTFVINTL